MTPNWPPNSPVEVKNQTQDKHDEVGVFKPNNNTSTKAPKSPGEVKNQTQNEKLRGRVGVFKQNQTTTKSQKSPVVSNQTRNSAPNSSSSSFGGKDIAGNGDKRIEGKGRVKKLSSFLSKKQRKEPTSDSEKSVESLMNCDLFNGDSYPLYEPGSCYLY